MSFIKPKGVGRLCGLPLPLIKDISDTVAVLCCFTSCCECMRIRHELCDPLF